VSAQHRHSRLRGLLDEIDRTTDPGLAIHVIATNFATSPAVKKWRWPSRVQLHFTRHTPVDQPRRAVVSTELQRRASSGSLLLPQRVTATMDECDHGSANATAQPLSGPRPPTRSSTATGRYCYAYQKTRHRSSA